MNTFTQPLLLGFSLALDCFAISISQGLKLGQSDKHPLLWLALLFGLFQAGMLVAGYVTGGYLLGLFEQFADWIAAGLLFYIGLKMIREGLETEHEEGAIPLDNLRDYITLAVATSLDALAAGVSLPAVKADFLLTTMMVGLISFGMALIGGFAGKKMGERFGQQAEVCGGLVLIGLGIKIFWP